MRRLLCILILITIGFSCVGQICAGIDLTSVLYREIRINIGYGFAAHWSFSASCGTNLKKLRHKYSEEEINHNDEYPMGELPDSDTVLHRESIGFRYWPDKAFNRFFLSLGAEYRHGDGLDACIGVGYYVPIWKGLKGVLNYETGLIRSVKEGKISFKDLRFGLSWTF